MPTKARGGFARDDASRAGVLGSERVVCACPVREREREREREGDREDVSLSCALSQGETSRVAKRSLANRSASDTKREYLGAQQAIAER